MNKTYFLLASLVFVNIALSQNAPIDFETMGMELIGLGLYSKMIPIPSRNCYKS